MFKLMFLPGTDSQCFSVDDVIQVTSFVNTLAG